MNYWIFQYTTNIYRNVINDLDNGNLCRWEIKKHKKNIKKGDWVVLYIGGKGAKFIYGTAQITSNPSFIEDGRLFSGIKIIEKFKSKIPLKKAKEEISSIKIGICGTNFTCTKEEFEKIIELGK